MSSTHSWIFLFLILAAPAPIPASTIVDQLEARIAAHPEDERAHLKLARALIKERHYAHALGELEPLLEHHPQDRSVLLPMVVCLYKLGELSRAYLLLDRLLRAHADDKAALALKEKLESLIPPKVAANLRAAHPESEETHEPSHEDHQIIVMGEHGPIDGSLVGTWIGRSKHDPDNGKLIIKIVQDASGKHSGTFVSSGPRPQPKPLSKVLLDNDVVQFGLRAADEQFVGELHRRTGLIEGVLHLPHLGLKMDWEFRKARQTKGSGKGKPRTSSEPGKPVGEIGDDGVEGFDL